MITLPICQPARASHTKPDRRLIPALHFAATTALAVLAAVATVASAQVATGTTGIDASGKTANETAACNSGLSSQARETCLREARNAGAERRAGTLDSNGAPGANAAQRCAVFQGEEKIACEARVIGAGETQGSVSGGGVIREVETVVVPADGSPVRVTPQTGNANIVVIPGPPK
jgi:hypothetical protein